MLDFGWTELILIMAVAVLVIGPSEIPGMMRGLGRLVRRLQYIKYAVARQFDDFMKDADMEDIGRSVNFEAQRQQDFDEEAADENEDFLPADKAEPSGDANTTK
ncbi:MAG: twin-arginine translocase TatA/TatE family subunit [Alphaproteobacteria bacterium]